jgi:hypothetical protein
MRIKNVFLLIFGFISLALGVAGIALPVLPTTPFVLLAAMCFSSSNKKIHDKLLRNRVFGQYIENYHTKQGISIKLKAASIASLWTGLISSIAVTRMAALYIVLPIIGVCVTIHLLLIKTKKSGD